MVIFPGLVAAGEGSASCSTSGVAAVAADDYESMADTDYLLRSPANAARLMTAAAEARSGRTLITKTMEELEAMADEGEPR